MLGTRVFKNSTRRVFTQREFINYEAFLIEKCIFRIIFRAVLRAMEGKQTRENARENESIIDAERF